MDRIFDAFLSRQFADGLRLAEASDLLELTPLGPAPVQRYLARFACATLVRGEGGEAREAAGFAVGIWFPADYLRRVNPVDIANWLAPANVFLPNVRPPFICLGRITPGTGLEDLLYQVHEIGVGAKLTVREDDALDPLACAWARRNMHRFPIDPRPLKGTALAFDVEDVS